ncbi:Metalloenzyme, LuxS/M16 peptidase-like protein [Coniella lustricola]|uniref:Presequence protease, mitochondrial n=1 Tax=Coniella lustricola TaxID=2025994 RepID=A0A2T3AJV1_9PEZI|nr:Metalloenzyme, LuxS/M16 peptidase-like protein [Coniella lustricola]
MSSSVLRNAVNGAKKAATELSQFPRAGEKLHGFTMLRSKHVPELELTALHLQHDKTGAEHIHIAKEDSNNVFSIGFKTNPPDDTGVPHILEHTTLCGSEKYPIRDPFFKMLPRTLSNFMNAFTASDHTFYPFATTNSQDFKNLMSVYIDATLHPLLKETDFTQEGWRIGPENPQALAQGQDAKAEDRKLVFKGVVYNEMKGQMSDAGYLYYIRFQDHIFPDINNSGGDPQKITDLTYKQLKEFHDQHYHPSNAKLFTYGDMPLSDHLQEIDAQLSVFERINGDMKIHQPIDLSGGPQDVTLQGPVDPLVDANKQYKTSVSWILGETSDVVESWSLSLISALLMDGYGSPLYKALIESGLGIDWSPNTGYDSGNARGIFSVGLSGVQETDVPKVKTELQKVLREVAQKGFESSKIDGYRHQIELSLKHKTASFGMSLLQRLKPKWFTGIDPFDTLAWNELMTAFEAKMAEGRYLEGLVEKYLLNDNTLTFTMSPSSSYEQDLIQEEADRLAAKIEAIKQQAGGEEAAQKLLEERELVLLEEQGKTNTEDLSCLPSVYVKDIPRQVNADEFKDDTINGASVQWHETPTNGLTYFRLLNILDNIPEELRPLVPLFTGSIMRLGTKDKTMEELEDLIKLKTGGVSVNYHIASNIHDYTQATEGFGFSGTALDRNVPHIFELLHKLVVETNFDSAEAVQQIRQLIQASADGVVNDIASSGHSYARGVAEAGLGEHGYLKEQVGGLTQVRLMTSLASRPESDQLDDVLAKLKQIQQLTMARGHLRAAITCGSDVVQANTTALSNFLGSFSGSPQLPPKGTRTFERNLKTFYPLPYQVYYGALAIPTTSYTSSDGASLTVLSKLLTHKHLHHEIREKGGAYGGGAYNRAIDGMFGFYSYRDPNPVNTLSIMRRAGQWAVDKQWSERDMEDAKLSVFQAVDAPRSASEVGSGRFVYGIDAALKQQRREQLLDVTREQVREVAQKYIVDALDKNAERAVFLGKQAPWVDGEWKVEEMDVKAAGAVPAEEA